MSLVEIKENAAMEVWTHVHVTALHNPAVMKATCEKVK